MVDTAIFLGAGASKAEGAPLQGELFADYFSSPSFRRSRGKMDRELVHGKHFPVEWLSLSDMCVCDSTGSGIKVEHGKCCRCQTATGSVRSRVL